MKIVLFGRTDRGGIKTHVLTLAKELSKRHQVTVISQDTLKSKQLFGNMYFLDIKNPENIIKNAIKDADVVHIHHPFTSSEFFPSRFSAGKPIVNTYHFSLGEKFISTKISIFNKLNILLVTTLAKRYSKISSRYIPVGSRLEKILSRYNKTSIINNGIDTNKFKPTKKERGFNEFTVGFIGRLDPEKNVENLILACKMLNVPLLIAGSSKISNDYLKNKYESDRIRFLGEVDAPHFYNKIDLIVSPSMMEANVSLTIIEAMASGIPVICGDCGGEEQQIKEKFGIITKQDAESIRTNIKKIMDSDYKKMGKEARKEAIKNFELNDKVKRIENIYKEVCLK